MQDSKILDTAKSVFLGKFITLNICIRKKKF